MTSWEYLITIYMEEKIEKMKKEKIQKKIKNNDLVLRWMTFQSISMTSKQGLE